MKYALVEAYSKESLQERVQEYLDKGYILYGYLKVSVVPDIAGTARCVFHQAVRTI